MADRRILDIGAACILVDDPQFTDGHVYGWLSFYDERHRPIFPLTSQTVCEYLMDIIRDPQKSDGWKAGAVTGWVEALCENSPQTFKSVLAGEHVSVMREVSR
jgi:hypothetical protein